MRALVFGAVLSGALAFSQTSGQTSAKSAATPDITASKLTVQGCVQGKTPGHFTLLQASTGATFEIKGKPRDFKHSRGKLVEVEASELAPTAPRGMGDLPQLQVTKLRVVAKRCPIQGNGLRPEQSSPPAGQNQPPVAATPRYQTTGAPDQTPPTAGTNPNGAGVSGAPSAGTGNIPKQ